ncbi:MAG: nuclear transport factor 2 family protein [Dolichospermum sp. BR01]|nr:nuclear transport factor 2 family protein [Dolichospermum sp. BR01]
MITKSENTLKIAHQAFAYFTQGLETGNWQAFLDMLTDDFTFWFPMGKFHGLNIGKERAKEFFEYVSEAFQAGIKITSLDNITSNEKTVIFEFRDEGNLFSNPYKNRVAVAFDIRDNQVCAYREYFGSDGKSY